MKSLWNKVIANAFDSTDNTIRGSFISQILTAFMVYIIYKAVNDTAVMERVSKLSEIILGFYFLSLGIWKTGQIIKYKADKND
jgi:surface polysaccharide O-acyltransferase-like enzyme